MNQATFSNMTVRFLLLAAASAGVVHAQDADRSFSVNEGDRVIVDVEHADLNIAVWDRSAVSFSVQRGERHEFEFSQRDGAVSIRGEHDGPAGLFGWFSNRQSALVTMNVPYRQHLDLRTSGGDIDLDRLQGEFKARTSGGDIEIGDSQGTVAARTAGGDIEVVFAGATTAGGELRTMGGDVTVRLPADAQVAIDANAMGGKVASEFEGADTRRSPGRNSLELTLNGGGPELVLRTMGGSVEILRPAR